MMSMYIVHGVTTANNQFSRMVMATSEAHAERVVGGLICRETIVTHGEFGEAWDSIADCDVELVG